MRNSRRMLRVALSVLFVAAIVPLGPSVAASASSVVYVDDDGDNGGSGTLESPWRTIEFAVAQAVSGDTIKVLPGTYSADPEQDFPIMLPPGVTLESTHGYKETIIQGTATTWRVITIENATENTIVRGFSITDGGEANGAAIGVFADATYLEDWPLIEDCFFEANDAKSKYGGAIACEGTFLGGSANPLIRNNVFQLNSSERGGAVYCGAYSYPRIRDNVFFGNDASTGGGALYVDSNHSKADITGNEFISNDAGVSGGGALWLGSSNSDSTLVQDNLFHENRTSGDGGAITISGFMDTTLERNIFLGNSAGGFGGAVDSFGNPAQAPVLLSRDNLYARNHSLAGAVYVVFTETTMVNDTVCDNTADGTNLAGVWRDPVGGSLNLVNCILGGHADNKDVAYASISHSLTENEFLAASGNIVGTNVIVASADFFDATNDDYRLKVGSRGIDEGDDISASATDNIGTTRPQDGDGNGIAQADMGYWERPDLTVGRIEGPDRYQTAADIALSAFSSADSVVLASGQDFPDALSAAGLCGALEEPLLLTSASSLPPATSAALDELAPEMIYIIGGVNAISMSVETALTTLGYDVERIAGADRYDTSAQVARKVVEVEGGTFDNWAFFARGDAFPDALSAAPMAYTQRRPILLVRPTSLPSVVASVADEIDVVFGAVLGGEFAVAESVKTQIDAIIAGNGGPVSERWYGADRYATAARIAQEGADYGLNEWAYLGIATGTNFPDALAGGVACGEREGVVLLTAPSYLPQASADALGVFGDIVAQCEVFGGSAAVEPEVGAAIQDALGW